MDTTATEIAIAAIGVIGVAGGSLATGVVQAAIGNGDRRRAGRASARMLFLVFTDAWAAMRRASDDTNRVHTLNVSKLLDTWDKHRPTLAVSLGRTMEFFQVEHAVSLMGTIAETWNTITGTMPSDLDSSELPAARQMLSEFKTNAEEAIGVLAKASSTRRERFREFVFSPFDRD